MTKRKEILKNLLIGVAASSENIGSNETPYAKLNKDGSLSFIIKTQIDEDEFSYIYSSSGSQCAPTDFIDALLSEEFRELASNFIEEEKIPPDFAQIEEAHGYAQVKCKLSPRQLDSILKTYSKSIDNDSGGHIYSYRNTGSLLDLDIELKLDDSVIKLFPLIPLNPDSDHNLDYFLGSEGCQISELINIQMLSVLQKYGILSELDISKERFHWGSEEVGEMLGLDQGNISKILGFIFSDSQILDQSFGGISSTNDLVVKEGQFNTGLLVFSDMKAEDVDLHVKFGLLSSEEVSQCRSLEVNTEDFLLYLLKCHRKLDLSDDVEGYIKNITHLLNQINPMLFEMFEKIEQDEGGVLHGLINDGASIDSIKKALVFIQDVDILDKDANSAFILAVKLGRADIAQLLFDKGADFNIADQEEKTALYYIERGQSKDMLGLAASIGRELEMQELGLTDEVRDQIKNSFGSIKYRQNIQLIYNNLLSKVDDPNAREIALIGVINSNDLYNYGLGLEDLIEIQIDKKSHSYEVESFLLHYQLEESYKNKEIHPRVMYNVVKKLGIELINELTDTRYIGRTNFSFIDPDTLLEFHNRFGVGVSSLLVTDKAVKAYNSGLDPSDILSFLSKNRDIEDENVIFFVDEYAMQSYRYGFSFDDLNTVLEICKEEEKNGNETPEISRMMSLKALQYFKMLNISNISDLIKCCNSDIFREIEDVKLFAIFYSAHKLDANNKEELLEAISQDYNSHFKKVESYCNKKYSDSDIDSSDSDMDSDYLNKMLKRELKRSARDIAGVYQELHEYCSFDKSVRPKDLLNMYLNEGLSIKNIENSCLSDKVFSLLKERQDIIGEDKLVNFKNLLTLYKDLGKKEFNKMIKRITQGDNLSKREKYEKKACDILGMDKNAEEKDAVEMNKGLNSEMTGAVIPKLKNDLLEDSKDRELS